MKILHVLQNYEPSKGGTQLLFKAVSEILVSDYGDQVTVVTTNSLFDPGSHQFQKLPSYEWINGVEIIRFPFLSIHRKPIKLAKRAIQKVSGKRIGIFDPLLRVPLSRKMKKFIHQAQADVVCGSSSNYSYMDYASTRFNNGNAKPFVFMGAIHFDDEENISLPAHILINILASDFYIANTNYEKKCLENLGVPEDKVKVVGCGVSLEDFKDQKKVISRNVLKIPQNAFVAGYLGRFAPYKGIETLIDAFARIDTTNSLLILAGPVNDYYLKIKETIQLKYSHISNRIRLIHSFAEELKPVIYSSLDVFASLSSSESFGITFLEAWAANVPVIGCDIGAVKCVIDDHINGRLCKAKDVEMLKSILLQYKNNPNLRLRHAEAGMKKVSEMFTWEIIAKKYREIYSEAISHFRKNY